jgi:hypothetical protein
MTAGMDNNYPDSFVQEPLTVSEKRNRLPICPPRCPRT